MAINLTDVLGPAFYGWHRDVKAGRYTHHWLSGGRGSLKSSSVAVEIILGVMSNPSTHALCLRKVGNTLQSSVYDQLLWAIDKLGVDSLWDERRSPLLLIYKPTGQRIYFRGADKPKKIKSIKTESGYFRFVWFEEVDEFSGAGELRNILQSVLRGGDLFDVFYSYNPPASAASWVNMETALAETRRDSHVHRSCYTQAPKRWLGPQFIAEAEHLKEVNPTAYRHEYLGEITGTGGEIFDNVRLERITPAQVQEFDQLRHGVDFGFATDPFVYIKLHYDRKHRALYIFDEVYGVRLSNRDAYRMINGKAGADLVIADSAEPKSIDELRGLGLHILGASKGPDSVRYGIQWLQHLDLIVIDPKRCPNAAREFSSYELDKDSTGQFISRYPDRDNHTIDAVRYALNRDISTVRVK